MLIRSNLFHVRSVLNKLVELTFQYVFDIVWRINAIYLLMVKNNEIFISVKLKFRTPLHEYK